MAPTRRTLFAAPALIAAPALAQGRYPERPVTIVVSFAAGGSTDLVGRMLAQHFSRDIGGQFVVENRAGASGTVGHASVARARPDGYTLLLGANSTYAMARHLFPNRGYDDDRTLVGVGQMALTPIFLCVRPDFGVRTVPELVARLKRDGAALSYASSGAGSSGHLATEMFLRATGTEMQNVTYRGGVPSAQALLTGEVQMVFVDAINVLGQMQAGNFLGLGVCGTERSRFSPETPTMAEAGVTGMEADSRFALFAPAGTPDAVIRRLSESAAGAVRAPDVVERWAGAAIVPAYSTPDAWPALVAAESARYREVIESRGIRAE